MYFFMMNKKKSGEVENSFLLICSPVNEKKKKKKSRTPQWLFNYYRLMKTKSKFPRFNHVLLCLLFIYGSLLVQITMS